jgi:hypothetical protein
MKNEKLQQRLELKFGYKVTINMSYKNGEQTIISYSLKNKNGMILKTETSLNKLLRNNY